MELLGIRDAAEIKNLKIKLEMFIKDKNEE